MCPDVYICCCRLKYTLLKQETFSFCELGYHRLQNSKMASCMHWLVWLHATIVRKPKKVSEYSYYNTYLYSVVRLSKRGNAILEKKIAI